MSIIAVVVMRSIFVDQQIIVTPAHGLPVVPIEVNFDYDAQITYVRTSNVYDIQRSEMMGRSPTAAALEKLRFTTVVQVQL